MKLCQYANIFGKPNTGVHVHRFLGFASVDLFLTIIIGIIISYMFDVSIIWTIIILFLLGIVVHKLFCVDTTLNTLIWPNKNKF